MTTPNPEAPEGGKAPTLAEVVAFLCGEAPLAGVWFGDEHPTEKGAFWWRKHLRAITDVAPSQAPLGDAQILELFADYDECKTSRDGVNFARAVLRAAGVDVPDEAQRLVSLNLLARAREHVPYMGETWKALTEAMTSGVKGLGDADR